MGRALAVPFLLRRVGSFQTRVGSPIRVVFALVPGQVEIDFAIDATGHLVILRG